MLRPLHWRTQNIVLRRGSRKIISDTALVALIANKAQNKPVHQGTHAEQWSAEMRTLERLREVVPPPMSEQEVEMAKVAQRCIMEALDHSRAAAITLTTDKDEHPRVELPPQALKFIGQVLGALSEGRPIVLMPANKEMTTVEAAHFLNVSRPFVIKEIEEGRLPHRMVGTHRRVAFEDLLAYDRKMREKHTTALERMADNARELGLDY